MADTESLWRKCVEKKCASKLLLLILVCVFLLVTAMQGECVVNSFAEINEGRLV